MISLQCLALSARRRYKRVFMSHDFLKSLSGGRYRWLVALLLTANLIGCASTAPAALDRLPQRVEISSVPFYRGNANYSSAMALAALLSQQGAPITPGLLDSALGMPERAASLEAAIARVAREYGRVVYPLDKRLDALLTQVAAGNPVLLRYHDGSALFGEPRYAVLIGYDRYKQRVLLRSGMSRRHLLDFDTFESAWVKEGAWAVLVQSPSRLPAGVDRQRWVKAADELAREGQEIAAKQALRSLGQ